MIPVVTRGVQFWLNFQHTKLPGADVRDIPRYEELERMLRAVSEWQSDTLRLVVSDDPQENLAAIEMGTRALLRMPENINALLQRVEDGLCRFSHRTVCNLSIQTSPTSSVVVASGDALTMKGDPFNRRIGRWWSLTRAMEALQEKNIGEGGDVLAAYLTRGNRNVNDSNREVEAYVAWYETEYLAKHPRVFAYFTDAAGTERYTGKAA